MLSVGGDDFCVNSCLLGVSSFILGFCLCFLYYLSSLVFLFGSLSKDSLIEPWKKYFVC